MSWTRVCKIWIHIRHALDRRLLGMMSLQPLLGPGFARYGVIIVNTWTGVGVGGCKVWSHYCCDLDREVLGMEPLQPCLRPETGMESLMLWLGWPRPGSVRSGATIVMTWTWICQVWNHYIRCSPVVFRTLTWMTNSGSPLLYGTTRLVQRRDTGAST